MASTKVLDFLRKRGEFVATSAVLSCVDMRVSIRIKAKDASYPINERSSEGIALTVRYPSLNTTTPSRQGIVPSMEANAAEKQTSGDNLEIKLLSTKSFSTLGTAVYAANAGSKH